MRKVSYCCLHYFHKQTTADNFGNTFPKASPQTSRNKTSSHTNIVMAHVGRIMLLCTYVPPPLNLISQLSSAAFQSPVCSMFVCLCVFSPPPVESRDEKTRTISHASTPLPLPVSFILPADSQQTNIHRFLNQLPFFSPKHTRFLCIVCIFCCFLFCPSPCLSFYL